MTVAVAARHLIQLFQEAAGAPADTVWASGSAEVLFMSADANKSDSIDGLAVDRVLDPLRLEFEKSGYKTATVALPGSQLVGDKTYSNALSFSRRLLWHVFFRSMNIFFVRMGLKSLNSIEADYEGYFEKVFQILNPSVILMTNTNDEVCKAAYKSEVPILEVLHARGYVSPYGDKWASRQKICLPDGVVAYDSISADSFSRILPTLRLPNYRLPFELELARKFRRNHPPPSEANKATNGKVLLFTTNYGDPNHPERNGLLPPELIQLVSRRDDLFLFVRMHPVMKTEGAYRKSRDSLLNLIGNLPNADIVWASEAPLLAVLELTDIHFTGKSQAAFEAADLGLKTFMLEKNALVSERNHFGDLVERNLLIPIETSLESFSAVVDGSTKFVPNPYSEASLDVKEIISFAIRAAQLRRRAIKPEGTSL